MLMYHSNRSFNIPPGQPPGHLNFWEIFVQIPPSRGRKAVQMPHHRSIPGDQMPPTPGNFSVAFIMLLRWPTSALRMPKDTPNSKLYSEFLNLTPNSKTSLRIHKNSLRIQKPHSEYKNLTSNSWTSLQIPKPHSEFKNTTPNSKNSNSKTSLRNHRSV